MKSFFFAFVYALYLAFGFSNSLAQVQIAPVALYLSDEKQTGRIVVRNSSDKPQELSIELLFAYPATDKNGEVYLSIVKEVPQNAPSALEWIRVYPRHLVLPPGQQQIIRFAARPPVNLPAGEYWVRPAISSSSVRNAATKVNERITTRINLIKRTFLSLNYRHEEVNTGLAINRLRANVKGNQLHVIAKLDRKGNAAYLGHTIVRIYDISGQLRKQWKQEIAVYHTQKRKFEVNINNLAPGSYKAELTFSTKSRAKENKDVLPAPPVSKSIKFAIK